MQVEKILTADFLDIIFDGRNKDYGAYELRKTYNKTLMKAMSFASLLILLSIMGYVFANKFTGNIQPATIDPIVKLTQVEIFDRKIELPLVPKPKTQAAPVRSIVNSVPLIVNTDVTPQDQPPTIEELGDTHIGSVNVEGTTDVAMNSGPVNDGRDIVTAPKKELDNYEGIFYKVEIESSYPGGPGAWMRYLNKTFRYPGKAADDNIQGMVVVQFIVDKEGNVSEVEAIQGPADGGLREEAVRVILKSGKWEPAIQNGRKVKSYKKQPISFRLESE